jgi:dolichol-phosphate mannosyltransferase
MKLHCFTLAFASLQAILGARVLLRLAATARGERIAIHLDGATEPSSVSVVVPVLDERRRLGPCLDGLVAQGAEVGEILVVDGGSVDGTPELVTAYAARDPRVRLVEASPVPRDWNGKAWGLQVGLERTSPASAWLLSIDADVRPRALLARSLVAHARRLGLAALSVATLQVLADRLDGLVHPSMLTTLVYRFGIPGQVARRIERVQANGQCMLFRRASLLARGGFAAVRTSRAEDVTLARALVAAGQPVGFFETDGLATVEMYGAGRETWQNWPRSLPLRDRYTRWSSLVGLLEAAFVQALPLPLALFGGGLPRAARALNLALAVGRLGVLVGTRRAYAHRPWTYWLSPICDIPVVARIWLSMVRRRHVWRGRVLVDGET